MDIHTLAKNAQEELKQVAKADQGNGQHQGGSALELQTIQYCLQRVEGYWNAITKSFSAREKVKNSLSILAAEKALSEAHEALKENAASMKQDIRTALTGLMIASKALKVKSSSLVRLHIADLSAAIIDIEKILASPQSEETIG